MTRTSALVALFALGAWSAVSAQDAGVPFACPKEGTVFETSRGSTRTARARDGWVCSFDVAGGEGFSRYGHFINAEGTAKDDYGDKIVALWPLKVGTKSVFSRSLGSGDREITLEVKEKKKLVVPAGEFEVILVEVTNRAIASKGTGYHATDQYYYAPSVGTYVKYDYILEV
jgi:hypothetical protein